MAVLLENREPVRPFLMRDPIRNAVVIHRMFYDPDFTIAVADAAPEPKGVMALRPAGNAQAPHQVAMHATDPGTVRALVRAVPRGAFIGHVADEEAFGPLRNATRIGWWREAILYRLDEKDFRGTDADRVRPLDSRWAAKIAKIWEPDWPAEGYVRSRIENGLNGAIYEDGEPVAWYMTHLETDEVVMLGFLHVLEPFRGQGYAKALSSALIRATFAKGKHPCCHVYTDNAPSIRLMEGIGFRRVCLQAWFDGVAPA